MRLKLLFISTILFLFGVVSFILFIEISSHFYGKKFFGQDGSSQVLLVYSTKGRIIPSYIQESFVVNLKKNPKQLFSDSGIELTGIVFENVLLKDINIIDGILKSDELDVYYSDISKPYVDVALTSNVTLNDLCIVSDCKWSKK